MPAAPSLQPAAHVRPVRRTPLATGLVALVHAYQRWISPALPARCRFYPTCSSYAVEAIRSRGAVVGLAFAVWRLLRCQPFHPGGVDLVPARRTPAHRTAADPSGAARPC